MKDHGAVILFIAFRFSNGKVILYALVCVYTHVETCVCISLSFYIYVINCTFLYKS